MSKINLNLKEFKHLRSDDKSTTLQHKEGHVLTLAHKSLSPESQEQLKALAGASKEAQTPEDSAEMRSQKMADGGEAQPKDAVQDTAVRPDSGYGKVIMINAEGGMLQSPDTRPIPQAAKDDAAKMKSRDADESAIYGGTTEKTVPNTGDMTMKAGEKTQLDCAGGEVKKYAEGDMVQADEPTVPSPEQMAPKIEEKQVLDPAIMRKREIYNNLIPVGSSAGTVNPMAFGKDGAPPAQFDPNTWKAAESSYANEQANNAATAAKSQQNVITVNQQRVAAGLPPLDVPNVPQGPQIPGSPGMPLEGPDQLPKTPEQQMAQPDPMANYEGMLSGAYKNQMAGIQGQAQATGQLGQQQAQILNQKVQADQQAQAEYKQHFDELTKERNSVIQDIKEGYISPEKYWTGDKDGNGGHSKIAAGIGMILAGFNPTNNPNAAVNFLKFQMEQNLNAQARNLGAKESLLSHNVQQFGNLRDAADMTRIQQADMLQHQLGMAAATAQTPMAKAAALKAMGDIQAAYAPQFMQLNMNRSMINMARQANGGQASTGNPTAPIEAMLPMMRQLAPDRAKEWESRLVPGVGVAQVPLTEDDRKEIIGKTEFSKMAQNYMQFAQQHQGSFSPAEIAQGKAMALNLQNAYRNATHGGIYKEGEQDMIRKIIPDDPTQFFNNLRTSPKLRQLVQDNNIGLNAIKSQKGMAVPQAQPQGYRPKSFQPAGK